MIRDGCRHYSPDRDYCDELRIAAPMRICRGCDMFEPQQLGLGDVLEKVIDIATLGAARLVARSKKGGCGCKKRRAALNRMARKVDDG